MLFVTGLLALFAISNAGGDHGVKGGGRIKGGDAQISGSAQQVIQEAIAPSPYSFNIDTSASYGAKVIREETGDAAGRVKGSYSISGPRGSTRVVHYTADETGFHANIKTNEPNVKTHSPANAQIEAVAKKGGSASVLIPVPAGDTSGIKSIGSEGSSLGQSRFAPPVQILRDPVALPVANQPAIVTTKTVKTLTSSSGGQSVKAVQKSIQTAGPSVGSNSGAREVIVYDDGTIVDAGSISGSTGSSSVNLQPLIGGISSGSVLKAGGQLSGGAREVIVYEDGTIEEVGGLGQGAAKSTVAKAPAQKPAIRTPSKPDLVKQRRPVATSSQSGFIAPVVSAPKPKLSTQAVQGGVFSDDIKLINRQLIQKQNADGVLQTFGGVAKSEADLSGLSISLDQIGGLGASRPVAPAVQLRQPAIVSKPKVPKPSVSAANRGQSITYTGNRIASGIPGPSAPRPVSGIGNVAGSISAGDDIKLINQQLIQRQNSEGVLQAFGGIVRSESDLSGLPVSLEQIAGYGSSRPVGPKIQLKQPSAVTKPKVPKPAVTSSANRGQTFKYTGNRVTSGILGSSSPRVVPGQTRLGQSQYTLSNVAGSIYGGDNIRLINRQLIQRQDSEGVLQAFGGIVRSESDLTGLPVSLEQISGLGASRAVSPAVQLRQPAAVSKPKLPKPSVNLAANRGQSVTYTGSQITSGIGGPAYSRVVPGQAKILQGYNYNAAGLVDAGDNIKLINKQLIERQNAEGVLQAFGGIVKSESDLTGLPVSLEQITGYGSSQPIAPAVQFRQPSTVTKPKVLKPSVTSTANRGQTVKYTGTQVSSGVVGPSSPRIIPGQIRIPQTQEYSNQYIQGNVGGLVDSGDNIKLINQQLIQRQNSEGVLQAFGGIVNSESDLSGLPVSLEQITGYGSSRPVAPVPQLRQPAAVTKPKVPKPAVTSAAGRDQTLKYTSVSQPAKAILASKPEIPTQVLPQGDNIVLLNRGLIQKQNEEGVLQAFGGIVKSEADLDGISISLEQLGGLSQISSYGAVKPQEVSPVVAPKRPASISSSQGSRQPISTRVYQSAPEVVSTQRFAPARISPQNTGSVSSTGSQRTATRTSSDISAATFGGTAAQVSSGISGSRQRTSSQTGLSEDLLAINRQLIEKQNNEGLRQTFGGIIRSEADLEDGLVFVDELEDITKLIGYSTRNQGPQLSVYSSSGQRSGSNQVQGPVEQSQIPTGLLPVDSSNAQSSQGYGDQLQVKVDDIDDPSSLSQVKDNSNIPSIQSLLNEAFKQVDSQENIPIEIQNYVPPMKPYNYRTQNRASSSDSPNVEQQKLEQILV